MSTEFRPFSSFFLFYFVVVLNSIPLPSRDAISLLTPILTPKVVSPPAPAVERVVEAGDRGRRGSKRRGSGAGVLTLRDACRLPPTRNLARGQGARKSGPGDLGEQGTK